MAIGKIKTLYSDTEKNEPLFPRTKTKAVTDSDGVGLDALLSNLTYAQEESDEIEISPIDSDTLGGLPADQYATKNFVKREILFVQSGGEVDLDEYATKEEVANIDFPVDSINGKTGAIELSASDVNALPINGGTLTGALNVGNNIRLWTDTEGGNVRIVPSESGKTYANYWEIDSYDGGLRFYANRPNTNPNGTGVMTSLKLSTDGSISVGNAAKTRTNLGVAPATADTTYSSCYYRTVDGVKEWINPPLALDTEYRTTERYNGKPVYIKRVNFGALPNKTFRSIYLGIGRYLPFWYEGYVKSSKGFGTTFSTANSIGCNTALDTADCVLTVETSYDFTADGYTAEVIFKYVK